MKALRMILYQNMVNYRREMSYGYVQTYPLPTPSMVKGMAHALLGLGHYEPLAIAVQGKYDTVTTNMQKAVKFDRKGRYPTPVQVGGKTQSVNYGVMFCDEIVNMYLMLHICFKDDTLNDQLAWAIRRKTVVLGRNEDIALVDLKKSGLTEVCQLTTDDDTPLENNIYLGRKLAKKNQIIGTAYRLPFYYKTVQSFTDKRIFTFVDTVYIAAETQLQSDAVLWEDEDGHLFDFLTVEPDDDR